jgi:hypothetical protein
LRAAITALKSIRLQRKSCKTICWLYSPPDLATEMSMRVLRAPKAFSEVTEH